jgi:hypothetical protein
MSGVKSGEVLLNADLLPLGSPGNEKKSSTARIKGMKLFTNLVSISSFYC